MAVDENARTVTIGGGTRYGEVAAFLHARGWALANLASLPHISVAGAVATGTHGSGDRVGSLAAAISALEVLGPDGELRQIARGHADFDGSVVGLGALGIVYRLTIDMEPTYQVRQDVYHGLRWAEVHDHFDAITSGAYSVSLFTDFVGEAVDQAWLKSRATSAPEGLFGAVRAAETVHMLAGAPVDAVTQQLGQLGPWHERLPHFRMGHTPSRGEELQSEYLLPRKHALTAFSQMRRLSALMAPLLQCAEIRTVAADSLWLSSSYGHDVVAIHFTWVPDPVAVYAVLQRIEDLLLPLGARPHWGKCFVAGSAQLARLYPRWEDFKELRQRVDPGGKFGNEWLDRAFGIRSTLQKGPTRP